MSHKNNSLLFLVLLSLAGCKQLSVPTLPGLGAYRIEIQQGNVVTQEMLDKLQPGMTRNQVRFVLGTPLIVDPFRNDRWDYVYTLNKGGSRIEQRQLKVYFKDDKMERYEGDIVADTKATVKSGEKPATTPAAKPALAIPETAKPPAVQPAPQAETAKPAPVTPAPVPDAANIKPALRLAPSEGEAAKPEDRVPPTTPPAAAAAPRKSESLDAPPIPRLVLPPEQPEQAAPAKPQ